MLYSLKIVIKFMIISLKMISLKHTSGRFAWARWSRWWEGRRAAMDRPAEDCPALETP